MSQKHLRRRIDGILLLDKPIGISSNAALQEVKHIFGAEKAGHTGSLDPLASGMLPICFGNSAKFSQFLLNANKFYRVIGKLGVVTASGDAEGEVLKECNPDNVSLAQIKDVLPKFIGPIKQIPSMYSAIKYKGQPLYKLARQGKVVEREPRLVNIYKLEIISYKGSLLELDVECSKGTYIRTLIEDIGNELFCGAHVVSLRRLAVGQYSDSQMIALSTLQKIKAEGAQGSLDNLLLSTETMVSELPKTRLVEAAIYYLKNGQSVVSPYSLPKGLISLVGKDGRFLGVGEVSQDGKIKPIRLI